MKKILILLIVGATLLMYGCSDREDVLPKKRYDQQCCGNDDPPADPPPGN